MLGHYALTCPEVVSRWAERNITEAYIKLNFFPKIVNRHTFSMSSKTVLIQY